MGQEGKELSNPFSTGGGGALFEAHIQASFVALMLTGGYSPILRSWPITKIKLQGKVDGYDTDDLIVFAEEKESHKQVKLLAQVKHSITISEGSKIFEEVVHAAWSDFHGALFKRGVDAIALITGPLSRRDFHNTAWMLDQARATATYDEFLGRLTKAKFNAPQSEEKYKAFKHHIVKANDGKDVPDEDVYDFLNAFHLLGYDLGGQLGVVQSLLHSHIGQRSEESPQLVWSRLVEFVQEWNKSAGTIVLEKIPQDIKDLFQKEISYMPKNLYTEPKEERTTDFSGYKNPEALALAALIGGWDEGKEGDLQIVEMMAKEQYTSFIKKVRELHHGGK